MKCDSLLCFTDNKVHMPPLSSGRLDGLKFAVKDLVSIKGHTSSFGNAKWRETHLPAPKTSSAVSMLLNEGAELTGMTKMDQLAYSIIGNIGEGKPPLNTKYPERFTGGSSSGSASAVAGGAVDFAIGSDTGGSVRIPAAACGIYGIRPTFGLIPMDGVIELAKSADVLGFFARNPRVLVRVMSIFANVIQRTSIKRILIPDNFSKLTKCDSTAIEKFARSLAHHKKLTIETIDIDPFVSPDILEILGRTQSREIWKAHGKWAEKNMRYLAKEVQDNFVECKKLSKNSKTLIDKDSKSKDHYVRKLEKLIGFDTALCLPILGLSGPNRTMTKDEIDEFCSCTFTLSAPSSLSGLPQISVPIDGATNNIGLIGPKNSDIALLELIQN